MLGSEALENMEFDVARKSFFRIRDCRSLLLVNELIVSFLININLKIKYLKGNEK